MAEDDLSEREGALFDALANLDIREGDYLRVALHPKEGSGDSLILIGGAYFIGVGDKKLTVSFNPPDGDNGVQSRRNILYTRIKKIELIKKAR